MVAGADVVDETDVVSDSAREPAGASANGWGVFREVRMRGGTQVPGVFRGPTDGRATMSRPGVSFMRCFVDRLHLPFHVPGYAKAAAPAPAEHPPLPALEPQVPGCETVKCRKCGGDTVAPPFQLDGCVHWCDACLCHTRHRVPPWAMHSA